MPCSCLDIYNGSTVRVGITHAFVESSKCKLVVQCNREKFALDSHFWQGEEEEKNSGPETEWMNEWHWKFSAAAAEQNRTDQETHRELGHRHACIYTKWNQISFLKNRERVTGYRSLQWQPIQYGIACNKNQCGIVTPCKCSAAEWNPTLSHTSSTCKKRGKKITERLYKQWPTFFWTLLLVLQLLHATASSPYADMQCNETWHPQWHFKLCSFGLKFSEEMCSIWALEFGASSNSSSPLLRRAHSAPFFLCSLSLLLLTNQTNPIQQHLPNANQWQWLKEPNKYFGNLCQKKGEKKKGKRRRSKPSAP